MNYEAAIEYAHQRMREVQKQINDYHIEPVYIVGTREERKSGIIIIPAYNEVYILVNRERYYGIRIIGDNSLYHSDTLYNSGVPEFTGRIEIHKVGSRWSIEIEEEKTDESRLIPIEFLRIVIY